MLHEEAGRALLHAPLWSTSTLLPFLPADDQAAVAAGDASWTLALGPLVPDLDTATHVAVVGGDTIWELDGAEREILATSDESRPLGVVSGGEAGRALCGSDVLPSLRTRSLAILALEACGVAARALELSVAYVSEREQFGRRIGSYQAVSHPLASSLAEIELARSLAWWAAWCVAHDEPEAPVAAAAAKAEARTPPCAACERAIQAHGGIGFTWEHVLHRLYKRALAIQALGGVARHSSAPRSRAICSTGDRRGADARALMMDYQLNVPAILRRADELYGDREIVSRLPDKSWHRYTYADFASRTKRLAVALRGLGLDDGDRVATLMWNHHEHLETYVGAPVGGFVTHTLNLRLHPDDNTYIASHAGDRVLVVDKVLWPLAAQFVDRVGFEHVIAVGAGDTPDGAIDYEELVASADESAFAYRDIDERSAAAMCFTSGTTGLPKGVVYSHRAIALHALTAAYLLGVNEGDTVLPVVPMFHANAWCFPFTCCLVGAKQVFPGPHLDPESLLEAFEQEKVTVSAGVPTIWMGILQALDATPDRLGPLDDADDDGRRLRAPARDDRGVRRAPRPPHRPRLGHDRDVPDRDDLRRPRAGARRCRRRRRTTSARSRGPPIPFVEIRARGVDGLVPWDGTSMGELEVRGPSVSSSYYEAPEAADRWTDDGWFRTGDIVTIGADGYVEIQDRSKDLVKSGGEWISTVALENALMGHPAVAEAAVIAVPDDKWSERPLAVVVLREGATATDGRAPGVPRAVTSRSSGSRTGSSTSTRSRRRPSASSARPRSGSSSRRRRRSRDSR